MTHKILRYHVTDPTYDVENLLKLYIVHYEPLKKPEQLINGDISYGELETFELVPDSALPYLSYVGMRDADDKEEREIEYKVKSESAARSTFDKNAEYDCGYTKRFVKG